MKNLLQDLSVLTRTKIQTFDYIKELSVADISQCVLEEYKTDGKGCSIDIGFGTLNLIFEDDEIQFKFIPSKELEKSIVNSINTGKSDLQKIIESNINNKMIKLYKELM